MSANPRTLRRQLAAAKRRWRLADRSASVAEVNAHRERELADRALCAWIALVEPLAAKALEGK